MFMEQLDGTILVTALPNIARTFNVTAAELDVAVSAYLVTLVVMIPASGWIADRFGARRVYFSAIVIFVLASILCGISQSVWQFIGARVLQGLGGSIMVPVGRLIVLKKIEKSDLMRAMAYLTWPALSAPLLGPPLGGFITTYWSWQWIFYINVPLGLIALVFAWNIVPRSAVTSQRRPFDAAGFGLTGLATLSLLFGIEVLGREGVSGWAGLALLALGAASATLAIRRGVRIEKPIISFDAFRVLTFRIALCGGGIYRACLAAVPFLLPLLLQIGFGVDPLTSGTLVLGLFAGNLGMKPGTSWILRRFGFRRTLLAAGSVGILTMLGCILLTADIAHPLVIGLLFISGLARSMQFTTINTIAFSDVPQAEMPSANALFSMSQQSGNAFGVAVAGALLRFAPVIVGGTAGDVAHFHFAFLCVAVLASVAMIDFFRMPQNAGDGLRGPAAGR
jgi:EmrB/QacA subfamily drug resistance transporter